MVARRRCGEALVGGIAPPYAAAFRPMGHAKIGLNTAPDDPMYLALIQEEKHWLKINPAAHDIVTMRKLPDDKVVLLVDSETDYYGNGIISGDNEKRTRIGEVYPKIDRGLARALDGEANFNTQPVTDRWGTWVTAWTPLYDEVGGMDGVLGVDYAAKDWVRGIAPARDMRMAQIGMLLVLLGSSVFVNGMLRADLEHRRQIEENLRRSQGRLALRAEQTPLAVIEWDMDLSVVDWNAAAERLFGRMRSEVIGVAMLDSLASEPVRTRIAALRDGSVEAQAAGPCTDTLITKDGRRIECEWLNAALVDGGRVIGVTSLCEDISHRRKAEEQLREAQKMEAFGQLAGGVAHEFNNKLVAIMGFTDIVRQRSDVPASAIADLGHVATDERPRGRRGRSRAASAHHARTLRLPRSHRQRLRDRAGKSPAYLRSIFHDQGRRVWQRPRARNGPWHCATASRLDRRREHAGQRYDLSRFPPRSRRRGQRARARTGGAAGTRQQ